LENQLIADRPTLSKYALAKLGTGATEYQFKEEAIFARAMITSP
jgi:hypothetical protein